MQKKGSPNSSCHSDFKLQVGLISSISPGVLDFPFHLGALFLKIFPQAHGQFFSLESGTCNPVAGARAPARSRCAPAPAMPWLSQPGGLTEDDRALALPERNFSRSTLIWMRTNCASLFVTSTSIHFSDLNTHIRKKWPINGKIVSPTKFRSLPFRKSDPNLAIN